MSIRLASESRRLLESLKPTRKGGKNKPDDDVVPIRERLMLEESA